MIRVFIGFDPREAVAYHACCQSIIENTSEPVSITPLYLQQIRKMLDCSAGRRDGSNDFIYSRFLVPALCDFQGWALYLDGDMVVRGDLAELWGLRDVTKDVHVVKHDYVTRHPVKYLGAKNESYPRKNWSSVILFNCSSFPNRVLTPSFVSSAPGAYLHRFAWLSDDRIGGLPLDWNWLVGEYDANNGAKLLHYTLGIPAFAEYADCDHAAEWRAARDAAFHCDDAQERRAA